MTLRLENLTLEREGFRLTATFELAEAQITAVIGPSGSGKSTLLSIIAGFEAPQQGRILFRGTDLTDLAPSQRPVSLVFQDNNLFPHLTVAQNVGLGLDPSLRLSAAQKSQVADALAEVGLEGFGPRTPGEMSGGQQSRAALARALLRDKPILLLDEAFSALGPALRRDMLDLVDALRNRHGLSVLMVTHDPVDAARVAANTIFVDDGSVAKPRPTQEVLSTSDTAITAYLGREHKD